MRKFGCNKVNKDFRDYKYKSVGASNLPSSYKISAKLLVKDQCSVNSCVAHTLSTFEEAIFGQNFSTNFLYGFRPYSYFKGEGMNIRDALHTLVKYGDCLNEDYPGNTEITKVYDDTNANLNNYITKASPYKIKSYARIFTQKQIKDLLLKDIPVPASIPIRGGLYISNGELLYNTDCDITGYHAILIIGYNEHGYIIQNSWGEYWGNQGTAILPYNYPLDSAWAINVNDNNVLIKEPVRWLAVIGNFIFNLFNKL